MGDVVYVRDVSSGRVQRIRVEGTHQLASFEGDNADTSGAYSVLSFEGDNADTSGAYSVLTFAELENTERDDLCRRCFPEPEAGA